MMSPLKVYLIGKTKTMGIGETMRRKMSSNLDILSFRYHEKIQMELP